MAPDDEMVVDVVVKVKVADVEPRSRVSERRLEEEAVSVVAECLAKEKAIELQEVTLLGFDHCKWVFEDGMPVECGLPAPVRLFTDGSWSYPYQGKEQRNGRDFEALVQFVQQRRGS
jgi:hypothetical protein